MPINIKAILDELGATGEDRSLLEGFFGRQEPLAAKLNEWREGGLRQADYSRRMDGLRAEETAKRAELVQQEQALVVAREGMNAQFLTAVQEREKAETNAAALAAQVKRLAAEWNIPSAEVEKILTAAPTGTPVAAPPSTVPGAPDTSQFVSRQEYDQLKQLALKMPALATMLPGMRAQHQELFGSCPMDFEQKLMEEAQKQQRPIEQVWDNLYGVNQKRQETHDATVRATAVAENDAKWKSQLSAQSVNPMPLRPELQNSPVFNLQPLNPNRPAIHGTAHAASSVSSASQAFISGKYRRPEHAQQE